jgi:hypothetical protein
LRRGVFFSSGAAICNFFLMEASLSIKTKEKSIMGGKLEQSGWS